VGRMRIPFFKVVGRPWVCKDWGAFLVELGGIFGCESFCQWIFFSLDSKSISGGVVYDETIFNYSICNKMK